MHTLDARDPWPFSLAHCWAHSLSVWWGVWSCWCWFSNSISPKLKQQLKWGKGNLGIRLSILLICLLQPWKSARLSLSIQPLALQRNEGMGGTWGGKWGSGKLEMEQGSLAALCQMSHRSHTIIPFANLRHTIHPASTNKHGMYYIKEFKTSKAPRSCWKGMWHVKWNLLLMQTSGLRFLAAVTQASPWGLTAGLDRTPNA